MPPDGQPETDHHLQQEPGINGTGGSVDLIAAWIGQPITNLSPVIGLNPKTQTATAGTDVTFTASASTIATTPPTVQWYISTNGGTSFTLISSHPTATTLDIGPATLPESGNEYEAIFTTWPARQPLPRRH